jgi:hypothetical protein
LVKLLILSSLFCNFWFDSKNIRALLVILENAFNILSKQRKDYSSYAGIWDLRYNWQSCKQQIITQIKTGIFDINPVTQYTANNEICYKRKARDALVLKAMSLVLNDYITPKLGKVYYLKGHGGIYGAIRHVKNSLAKNKFIFKNKKTFIGKIAKGFFLLF